MDGTLIDSYRHVIDAYAGATEALGEPGRSRDEIAAAPTGGPARVILANLLRREVSHEEVEIYYNLLERFAPRVPIYEGIEDMLASLSAPAAVFTGASTRSAEILLGAARLDRHFPIVVGGDQVENR